MNKTVNITFDYELFFGPESGSVNKCLIEPTNLLFDLAKKHDVKFVFFVDAGFLWHLKKYLHIEKCKAEFDRVSEQIKKLSDNGHEIALHVHPHWEDSIFENSTWKINVNRYKLSDFNDSGVEQIITKYHQTLIEITGKSCKSFRAGGWCMQPFSKIKKALEKNNIFVDSSVYRNGFHQYTAQSYDFRTAPDKTEWNFEDNECIENTAGKFSEIAITPSVLSPSFYFGLYLRMKLNPGKFKPMGDGTWLKDKNKIYKQFYSRTDHFACCDGFFASRLKPILLNLELEAGKNRMLILGHPKSMAKCSFTYLDEFIFFAKNKGYNITTLTQ